MFPRLSMKDGTLTDASPVGAVMRRLEPLCISLAVHKIRTSTQTTVVDSWNPRCFRTLSGHGKHALRSPVFLFVCTVVKRDMCLRARCDGVPEGFTNKDPAHGNATLRHCVVLVQKGLQTKFMGVSTPSGLKATTLLPLGGWIYFDTTVSRTSEIFGAEIFTCCA
ncbi:hypothetical protein EDB85DRAFT_288513 [Lactarius pseudohatsudake]|nr:hypothetical protein EDB85DRAFT_288513 [Lactarius pseudohatsudake]